MYQIEEIKNKIHCADCLEFMKNMPDNCIDTIITDPPYAINFMSKKWDDDIALKKEVWEEVLRIAKPGATLLCFGSPRTYHRLVCAVEDAGWIIKDCIMWIHSQGFPKSTNIAKQIAKKQGAKKQGAKKQGAGSKGNTFPLEKEYQDYELTTEAKIWKGWHSHGLKPSYEPILVAVKPNEGSYAENALKWEVAGLNIDEGRIEYQNEQDKKEGQLARPSKTKNTIFPIGGFDRSKRDEIKGRFPANIILECLCDEIVEGKIKPERIGRKGGLKCWFGSTADYIGRWPEDKQITHTNPECPCYILDKQSGGASRFFYCAKVSSKERNQGLNNLSNKNNHPTVKPLKLMEYLCLLTKTPTRGIVLDCFAGSGTTGMACIKTNRPYILIEKESEYVSIAKARINATSKPMF